ncbi:hypothetical protein AMS58_08510 [Pseudoalteromonas porphyrae]|uniref:Uncharacterized protein n=2 Tax=Pseudoalteromonas TaxID=53246 RepID=A0A0N1EWV9_9GAMM|nr:hypothetical protein ADS77_03385 [Pseudoalteromonas porphyrae]KPH94954.1 hypothetical protein AMS58_08510 [Pseudoalteromonas porphyrae]
MLAIVHDEAECAHCGSHEFTKYGTTARGLKRYKYKACTRTFNSLSGTPLFSMKNKIKGIWFTVKNGINIQSKKLQVN